jgi:hypothetical protein
MLEKEFKYYIDNQPKLVEKYNGKYIVIVGNKVVGVYDSEIQAYTESKNEYSLGTFLIQLCKPGKDSYTQSFHSSAIFS